MRGGDPSQGVCCVHGYTNAPGRTETTQAGSRENTQQERMKPSCNFFQQSVAYKSVDIYKDQKNPRLNKQTTPPKNTIDQNIE